MQSSQPFSTLEEDTGADDRSKNEGFLFTSFLTHDTEYKIFKKEKKKKQIKMKKRRSHEQFVCVCVWGGGGGGGGEGGCFLVLLCPLRQIPVALLG